MTTLERIKAKLEAGEMLTTAEGWVLWHAIHDARMEERRRAASARSQELRALEDSGHLRIPSVER